MNVRSRYVRRHSLLACVSAVAVLSVDAFMASVSYAQSGLEEIVVTARKRQETLMQVPLAITAVTAADLQNEGIVSLEDLARYSPGFFSTYFTYGGTARNDRSLKQVTLRGFSLAPGIVFIDGAPITAEVNGIASGGITPELSDVERVEVLKGPQNAYFGRSTFSGAVNYITKDPSNEFKGEISAEYSSYHSDDITLSLEGPIVNDKLDVRIQGHHMLHGGEYDNFANPEDKLGKRETDSVSAILNFKPSDSFRAKAYFAYDKDDDGAPAQASIKPPEMNCNLGGTRGAYYCGTLPNANQLNPSTIATNDVMDPFTQSVLLNNSGGFWLPFDPHFDNHYGLERHALQTNLRLEYETSAGYTITSISSYNWDKQENILDLTYRGFENGQGVPNPSYNSAPGAVNPPGVMPFVRWALAVENPDHVYNEELRITSPAKDRFRWLFGGDYLDTYSLQSPVYGYTSHGIGPQGQATLANPNTESLFAGAYYDFTQKLTFSGEVRYQWDHLANTSLTSTVTGLLLTPPLVFNTTFHSFAPRASVDYKYADNSTVYALWSRGARPGGFNSGLVGQPAAVLAQLPTDAGLTFKEDRLDNYEAGLKSSLFDGKLNSRLALYYDVWSNGQVPTQNLVVTNGAAALITITRNVGSIDLYGIEEELDYKPTDHLVFNGTLGISQNKVNNFGYCTDCLVILGTSVAPANVHLQVSPRQNWSLSTEYHDHLAGDYDWFARMDYTHRGSYFADQANVAVVSASDQVNLHIGTRTDKLEIEAFVKNLTKDASPEGASVGPDTLFSYAALNEVRYGLPDKRTFGLRAHYLF